MATDPIKVRARSKDAARSHITNARGGAMDIVFSSRIKGFTPLEVQAAALAACMDVSLRIAARQAGLSGLGDIAVSVEAAKADAAPSRLARFNIEVSFSDTLDEDMKARLVREAEAICTISNTLAARDVVITSRAE